MAAAKGKKKSKKDSAIPMEQQEWILSLTPEQLAVEIVMELNALETLKQNLKEDAEIADLKEKKKDYQKRIKAHKEDLDKNDKVAQAREALDKALNDNMSEEHLADKESLAQISSDIRDLEKSIKEDIKHRSSLLKFMQKTARSHIGYGSMKRAEKKIKK